MKHFMLFMTTIATAQAAEQRPSTHLSAHFLSVDTLLNSLLTPENLSKEELLEHEKTLTEELIVLKRAYERTSKEPLLKHNKKRVSKAIDRLSLGIELISFVHILKNRDESRAHATPSPRVAEQKERFAALKVILQKRLDQNASGTPETLNPYLLIRPTSCPTLSTTERLSPTKSYVSSYQRQRSATTSTVVIEETEEKK